MPGRRPVLPGARGGADCQRRGCAGQSRHPTSRMANSSALSNRFFGEISLPSGSAGIAGAGGSGPARGTRQDVESALSPHGRGVSAPRLTREAQGRLLGARRHAPGITPAIDSGEAERGLHPTPRAGGASPGVLSLVPFFSRKRKELARRTGERNPTTSPRDTKIFGYQSGPERQPLRRQQCAEHHRTATATSGNASLNRR